jgi:site-specific recombinase XerD
MAEDYPVILWGEFSAWMLDERGWPHTTRQCRVSTVKTAHTFIQHRTGRSLLRAHPEDLLAFLSEARCARTRNTYLAALKAFYLFAFEKGHRRTNPTEGLRRMREAPYLPRPLSPLESRRLLKASVQIGGRCEVVVATLLYAGLRIAELSSLAWADVDLDMRRFRILGKGAKERVIPIAQDLVPLLGGWQDGFAYVFPSPVHPDLPMSPQSGRKEVYRAAKAARLCGVTPHRLRHSFATDCLAQGADIREVQVLMGHVSLSSTQVYTLVTVDRLEPVVDRLKYGLGRVQSNGQRERGGPHEETTAGRTVAVGRL